MQEEFIREVETNRPEYSVYVNNPFSWLIRPESEKRLLDWWPKYWADNLELIRTVTTQESEEGTQSSSSTASDRSGNYLAVFKRKD